jgi:hypothetical protein
MSVNIPSTDLTSEAENRLDSFVQRSPNSTHTINEREKGVSLVRLHLSTLTPRRGGG